MGFFFECPPSVPNFFQLILNSFDGIEDGTVIFGGKRKQLTSIKTTHRNRLNVEPALIFSLTKIRPQIELLACQKQAHWSHLQIVTILIIDKTFNHTILFC
jgi:hypothetical protein